MSASPSIPSVLSRRLVGLGSPTGKGDDLGESGRGGAGSGWRRRGGLGGLCLWPGAGSPATATPAPRRPWGPSAPRAPCLPRSRPLPRWLRWRRPRWLGAPQRRESWDLAAGDAPERSWKAAGKVKPGGGVRGEARAGRTPLVPAKSAGTSPSTSKPEDPAQPGQQRQGETRWLFACSLRSAVCEPP